MPRIVLGFFPPTARFTAHGAPAQTSPARSSLDIGTAAPPTPGFPYACPAHPLLRAPRSSRRSTRSPVAGSCSSDPCGMTKRSRRHGRAACRSACAARREDRQIHGWWPTEHTHTPCLSSIPSYPKIKNTNDTKDVRRRSGFLTKQCSWWNMAMPYRSESRVSGNPGWYAYSSICLRGMAIVCVSKFASHLCHLVAACVVLPDQSGLSSNVIDPDRRLTMHSVSKGIFLGQAKGRRYSAARSCAAQKGFPRLCRAGRLL